MLARLAVLAACLGAALLPFTGAGAANPQLVANVGLNDNFGISLDDANGNNVTHLDPGTYTILVHDHSSLHNFDLAGPGVSEATDVEGIGDSTWTVTFTDAVYKYVCDAHPTVMKGSFAVGTATLPRPATRLSGSVGPGRKISLRNADGSKLTTLAGSNQVVIAVNDRSRTDNFHLIGNGVNKATGVRFRGRASWKLTLAAGKYVYRSDRHKSLHGSFTVPSSSVRG
jgi:plastocyanin